MPDYFAQASDQFFLGVHKNSEQPLRRAQLAAIWALSAHILSDSAPAQAVLPTGSGKSAVITALPFTTARRRCLVLVPSRVTRQQLAREFRQLRTLKNAGIVPPDIAAPDVYGLDRRVTALDQYEAMAARDVVITTPNCISPHYSGIVAPPEDFFDLVVVDEAHHAPAKTWAVLLEQLRDVPRVLLTATPIRRDRKLVQGQIVFWYRLAQAMRDRIYSPIDFIPVEPREGEAYDDAIARVAVARLRGALHAGAGSQLLVRTNRLSEAARLREVYRQHGVLLQVVTGELTTAELNPILEILREGRAPGVIVVGALTEGFDLPLLKIAAYHAKHQSLAATLQFVGRLARTVEGAVMQAELVAIPNEVSDETAALYQSDASWSELLPDIVDTAVDREREIRRYLSEFSGKPEDFALEVVQPKLYARAYNLAGHNFDPSERPTLFQGFPLKDFFVDPDGDLCAFVTEDILRPDWLRSNALDTLQYNLHIACVDQERRFLFISSPTDVSSDALVRHVCGAELDQVTPSDLNQALHAASVHVYSTLGMRHGAFGGRFQGGYKVLAASAAEEGISADDQMATTAGHAVGRYLEGQTSKSIGVAFDSAKVWANERASLYAYREWCNELANQFAQEQRFTTPPLLNIAIRDVITEYPSNPIAATLDHRSFDPPAIAVVRQERIDVMFWEMRTKKIGDSILLGLASDGRLLGTTLIDIQGNCSPGNRRCLIEHDDVTYELDVFLSRFPPTLYFADGTSIISGKGSKPPSEFPPVAPDTLTTADWEGVDPRRESKPPRPGFRSNILDAMVEYVRERTADPIIIVDDGSGEIADLIVLSNCSERSVVVELFHCKYSKEEQPGHRLGDITEVLGQAIRSTRWCYIGKLLQEIRRRTAARQSTRVIEGRALLERMLPLWLERSPLPSFRLYTVQPGLRVADVSAWPQGSALIFAAQGWCRSLAPLSLIGS